MHDLGLAHNKPFRKCARVVGEVGHEGRKGAGHLELRKG